MGCNASRHSVVRNMFALLKANCGLYIAVEIITIDLITNEIKVGRQHPRFYTAEMVPYNRVVAWDAKLVDSPW